MEKPTTQALTIVNFVTLIAAYLSLNTSLNLLNKVGACLGEWQARGALGRRAPPELCPASLQWALGVYGFRFPFLLTSTHMAFSFLVLAPFALRTSWETHLRTLEKQWKGILYIGGFMALNIALNNISLLDISLSLNQVIRWGRRPGGGMHLGLDARRGWCLPDARWAAPGPRAWGQLGAARPGALAVNQP